MKEKIIFSADNITLSGTLHLPESPSPPVVIGAHGLLSTGDSPKQQALAEQLNRTGIAYLRFDHRGCGNSQGIFSEVTTFEGRCNDLAAAIHTVLAHPAIGGPIGLFGSSVGGAVCLATAPRFAIRAIVTLAAPVRLASIRMPLDIESDSALNGMDARQMAFDISDRLGRISDILIVHGDADRVVPYVSSEEIFEKVGHSKKHVCLKGADHRLTQPCHQEEFMEQTISWLTARLGK